MKGSNLWVNLIKVNI